MSGYTKNFLYIYSTQVVSMLLGMFSLFIVIPYLSSNKDIYGVYAICSSLTIFFSYADIGFISAGQKFAAEAFIQNEHEKELKIIGFSGAVFLSVIVLISSGLLIAAYNPNIIIKDIQDENASIATSLLIILACSSPILCFHRLAQLVYSIRLKDYYFQLMNIGGNFLKIMAVFPFFSDCRYDIVGYYFTHQIITLVIVVFAFVFSWKKFDVSFLKLIRKIRFERDVYELLKGLAFASVFSTICWILYYELDNIAISKLFGAQAVAVYAAAFSILAVFRSLFGSCFNPYTTRFNYFVGLNDISGLNSFVKYIMEFFLPVCTIPIIVMSVVSGPFVISWVGEGYNESAIVLSLLLFCNVLAFISYPSGLYITAIEKNRYLYYSSAIVVVVFWLGVSFTYTILGVSSFAIMKTVAMVLSSIYSFCVVFYFMKDNSLKFIKMLFVRYLLPVASCVVLSFFAKSFMINEKGTFPLMVNICIVIITGLASYICFLPFSSLQRNKIIQVLGFVFKK